MRTHYLSLRKKSLSIENRQLTQQIGDLGMNVDESGHLSYSDKFQAVKMNCDLVIVRHGETFGNCGQVLPTGQIDQDLVLKNEKNKHHRIYQGNVDTEINQLTIEGERQAKEAAKKLKENFLQKGWIPDIILVSPLKRAIKTAEPFIQDNKFNDKQYIIYDGIKEMSFGLWDNKRLCDFSEDDECHLFYREQNVLVKGSGSNTDKIAQEAECFCDVLLRAHRVLVDLNSQYAGKKILIFTHSMFGAACCILLGRGQMIENGDYLAFDGHKKDGSCYTLPHATPIHLTPAFSTVDALSPLTPPQTYYSPTS